MWPRPSALVQLMELPILWSLLVFFFVGGHHFLVQGLGLQNLVGLQGSECFEVPLSCLLKVRIRFGSKTSGTWRFAIGAVGLVGVGIGSGWGGKIPSII